MEKLKKCPKCGRMLSESRFYKDITQVDSLSVNCKKCVKKYFKRNQTPQTYKKGIR